jgi:uncharacterized damage-inducible protein DinB
MSARKTRFLETLEREHERTMRVLRAYPAGQEDFRPHPKMRTAKEVAAPLWLGQSLMVRALTTGFDWSRPPSPSKPPDTVGGLAEGIEKAHREVVETLNAVDDARLDQTVKFMVAPKTLGDIPTLDFLWFVLLDHVHHRGQFSVYLRASGAKVPGIYGPSADEPWL